VLAYKSIDPGQEKFRKYFSACLSKGIVKIKENALQISTFPLVLHQKPLFRAKGQMLVLMQVIVT